jgi:hypothetical protein
LTIRRNRASEGTLSASKFQQLVSFLSFFLKKVEEGSGDCGGLSTIFIAGERSKDVMDLPHYVQTKDDSVNDNGLNKCDWSFQSPVVLAQGHTYLNLQQIESSTVQ